MFDGKFVMTGVAPRVRRLVRHPTESSWLISSMQGHNEVTLWNMESSNRQVILWGSSAPPLSSQVCWN